MCPELNAYPIARFHEQKRKIEKNEFLRNSLDHPKLPKERKDNIIQMIYDASKKGLET